MLDFFSASVTLTLSSFRTSWSGDGRKSLTIFSLPMGSSVYLILLFINLPSFSPISGAIYADDISPVRESNSHNSFTNTAYAVISVFFSTVFLILYDYALRIQESLLSERK